MAQKSLPVLNKVNTSMIWYSTYYSKYYKWLSSQTIFFLYFFNKLTVFTDLFFFKLMWVFFEKTSLSYGTKIIKFRELNEKRYFKPVTSYLISLKSKNIIINVFYKTSLQRFQQINWKTRVVVSPEILCKNIKFLKKIIFL